MWSISCWRQRASSPFAADAHVLAGTVLGLDHNPLEALYLAGVARDGKAAFVPDLLTFGADDLGIDEGVQLVVDLGHDDAQEHADLGRRQPDTGGVAHGIDHVVDQFAGGIVDLRHLGALGAQASILHHHDVTNHGESLLRAEVPSRCGPTCRR